MNMISNNPPHDADLLKYRLENDYAALKKACDDLEEKASLEPDLIEDEASAARLTDLAGKCLTQFQDAEAKRTTEKEPYLQGGKTVDSWFGSLKSIMDETKKSLLKKVDVFQAKKEAEEKASRDEEERVAREAAILAAQKAQEAADALETSDDLETAIETEEAATQALRLAEQASAAAQAKPADMSRVYGSTGASASRKTFWNFRGLDRQVLDLDILRPYIGTDIMEKAVKAYLKAAGKGDPVAIKGCEFFKDSTTQVRR